MAIPEATLQLANAIVSEIKESRAAVAAETGYATTGAGGFPSFDVIRATAEHTEDSKAAVDTVSSAVLRLWRLADELTVAQDLWMSRCPGLPNCDFLSTSSSEDFPPAAAGGEQQQHWDGHHVQGTQSPKQLPKFYFYEAAMSLMAALHKAGEDQVVEWLGLLSITCGQFAELVSIWDKHFISSHGLHAIAPNRTALAVSPGDQTTRLRVIAFYLVNLSSVVMPQAPPPLRHSLIWSTRNALTLTQIFALVKVSGVGAAFIAKMADEQWNAISLVTVVEVEASAPSNPLRPVQEKPVKAKSANRLAGYNGALAQNSSSSCHHSYLGMFGMSKEVAQGYLQHVDLDLVQPDHQNLKTSATTTRRPAFSVNKSRKLVPPGWDGVPIHIPPSCVTIVTMDAAALAQNAFIQGTVQGIIQEVVLDPVAVLVDLGPSKPPAVTKVHGGQPQVDQHHEVNSVDLSKQNYLLGQELFALTGMLPQPEATSCV